MQKYWRTMAVAGGMTIGLTLSSASAQTQLNETDQDFIETAAQSGAAEVAMGKEMLAAELERIERLPCAHIHGQVSHRT